MHNFFAKLGKKKYLWLSFYCFIFFFLLFNSFTYLDADFGWHLKAGEQIAREKAASVIRVVLGFLGIIAVVIILLGGFKWMTAAGNEDSIDEAKKLISAGVIGLVIILAAFGIAQFIVNNLVAATA